MFTVEPGGTLLSSCMEGLRPIALLISVAQSSHKGVGVG